MSVVLVTTTFVYDESVVKRDLINNILDVSPYLDFLSSLFPPKIRYSKLGFILGVFKKDIGHCGSISLNKTLIVGKFNILENKPMFI